MKFIRKLFLISQADVTQNKKKSQNFNIIVEIRSIFIFN